MASNWTQSPPRLVIAAPQGRSGKTTITLGVCAALSQRGLRVQPFKKGPDYIDPSWLSAAAGFDCRTLDPFFLDTDEALIQAFLRGSSQADLSIIEGNHGLYDSLNEDGSGSTAQLSRALQAAVILVVNAERMSRSVAALVSGYQNFEPQTKIAGVILNRVANQRHESKLRQAIETYCQIPVLGALPRKNEMAIPDRHLGLVPKGEDERLATAIEACRQAAESQIDLQALLDIAQSAPALPSEQTGTALGSAERSSEPSSPSSALISARPIERTASKSVVKIGIVRDRAFSFYYPENIEALEQAGAELVFLDAFTDRRLPEIQALVIGGGFPELFLDELSANIELMQDIAQKVEYGLPVYAECAGLMYLSRQITYQGSTKKFAGVLPLEIVWEPRPQGHGYVLAEVTHENPFFPVNTVLRGHEFHHSTITTPLENLPTVYALKRGSGITQHRDGYVYRNVLASYTHLHADGSPLWAEAIVLRARKYAMERVYG